MPEVWRTRSGRITLARHAFFPPPPRAVSRPSSFPLPPSSPHPGSALYFHMARGGNALRTGRGGDVLDSRVPPRIACRLLFLQGPWLVGGQCSTPLAPTRAEMGKGGPARTHIQRGSGGIRLGREGRGSEPGLPRIFTRVPIYTFGTSFPSRDLSVCLSVCLSPLSFPDVRGMLGRRHDGRRRGGG